MPQIFIIISLFSAFLMEKTCSFLSCSPLLCFNLNIFVKNFKKCSIQIKKYGIIGLSYYKEGILWQKVNLNVIKLKKEILILD